MEIDTVIRNKHKKPCPNCSPKNQPKSNESLDNTNYSLAKKRRNGSIQNMRRPDDSL